MIALLEERFRSAIDHELTACGARSVPIGRFVISILQGTSPQAEDRPRAANESGVLKLNAVSFGEYRPEQSKVLPDGFVVDPDLIPRCGDLLVTRSNTPNYVGDVCIVLEEDPGVILCDLIYRLRLGGQVRPEFAAWALLGSRARWHLSSAARGTSQSMVKLRGEDVRATPIPFLSIDRQHQLVAILDKARLQRNRATSLLKRQMGLLAEHRQALITAAVTGDLAIEKVAA